MSPWQSWHEFVNSNTDSVFFASPTSHRDPNPAFALALVVTRLRSASDASGPAPLAPRLKMVNPNLTPEGTERCRESSGAETGVCFGETERPHQGCDI